MKKYIYLIFVCLFVIFSAKGQTVFINEDFSSASGTTPPSGWKQNQLYSTVPATDLWHFDNPGSRSIAGNFSGQFAIFDSENYSNNAVYENIALESPQFNTQGHDSVYLIYDYRLGNGGTANLFIEGFNGAGWVEIKFIPNSYVANQRDTLDISNFLRNNCKSQIRFRWTSNSGGHFAVDNIKIYSKRTTAKTTNARPSAFVTPVNGVCGSTAVTVNVRVRNDGTSAIGSFPVYVKIFDGNNTQSISQTAPANIAACTDTVVKFTTTVSMNTDSTFTLTAITGLSGDQQITNSDTLIVKNIKINQSPAVPSAKFISVCGFGSYTDSIQLNAGDDAFWYEKATGGSVIQIGKYFSINPLNKDSIVYVETLRSKKGAFPLPNKSPNVGYNGISSGLFFDVTAFSDIVIDSIQVDTRTGVGTSFPYTIDIYKGSYIGNNTSSTGWTQIVSRTETITTGTNMQLYAGNIKINAGETVGIYFHNNGTNTIEFASGPVTGANSDLKYYSNDVHPYGKFGSGLNNFGYGGTIFYRKACYSARVKHEFDVNKRPSGARISRVSPFKGFIDGARDVIKEKDTLTYELTPPTGFSNTGYGADWTINSVTLITGKGVVVKSSDYKIINYPSTGNNFKIACFSPMGWADSTIFLSIKISELLTATKCDSTLIKEIFIGPTPKIGFTFNNVCLGGITQFVNTSTIKSGYMSYKWEFGNGDSTTQIDPVYVYSAFGLYKVKLSLTSNYNIKHDTTIQVEVFEIPNVIFKVINACFGDSISFINTTSISRGILSYTWDFADGISSVKSNPRHKYVSPGSYPVKLTATANGCINSLTKNANQFVRPVANFTSTGNCTKNIVYFTNTSTIGLGDKFGSQWLFGDGSGNNDINPEHTYSTGGIKTVKLIAYSQFGCKDSIIKPITILESPEASFIPGPACNVNPVVFNNTTSEPAGVLVSYKWTFGDGGVSTIKNPQHSYPFLGKRTITLTASGNNNCSTFYQKEINVLAQPKANFKANDVCIGQSVTFSNSTFGSGIITYKWKFGDGDSSSVFSPVKKYTTKVATTYNVTLTASTLGGCKDSKVIPLNIDDAPSCNFTFKSAGTGGFEYIFTPEVKTYSFYQWSFEGGGQSNAITPTNRFPADGKYRVRVFFKTIDKCECIDSSQFVTVYHLGVKSVKKEAGIEFFPNPNNGIFTLRVANISPTESFTLNINDLAGKQLFTTKLVGNKNHEISYPELSNGIYTIEIIKQSGERSIGKMNVVK